MFRFVVSIAALSIASIAPSAFAATIYDSSAAFLPLVAPGAFLNTFSTGGIVDPNGIPPNPLATINYSGSGYAYTVTADASGVYVDNVTVGNWATLDPVIVTFTGNPVTAIGGNFFLTNLAGTFQPVAVTIQLSDGTSETFTPANTSAYRGFISTEAITSMTLPSAAFFHNIDNLTVGTAVPEPTTVSLIATVGATAWFVRRRRTNQVASPA
jgi:hypothetical protein